MAPPPRPHRPLGVAILAILIILAGFLLMVLFGLAFAALLALSSPGILLAIDGVLFLFGILILVSGIGLWNLRPWAWWLATIVVFLELVLQVLAIDWKASLTFGILLPLIVVGIIFVYLLAVRGAFRQAYAAR